MHCNTSAFSQASSIQCESCYLYHCYELQINIQRVKSGASLKEVTPEQIQKARIYRRAYTAFQLRDLSNEVPLATIAQRYRIPRGTVQTLAQQCHGFAAGIVKFCQRMNWGMLAAVLDHMRDRLEAGARSDLLEMAQVTFVQSWTARLLRENGFRNLRALAEADPKDLVPVLMMVCCSTAVLSSVVSNADRRFILGERPQDAKEPALPDRGGEVCRKAVGEG